nr:hypothetical protein CFP56_63607 [Quercus suber]
MKTKKANSYEDTNVNELESSISVADSSKERTLVSSFLKPRKVLHKRKGISHTLTRRLSLELAEERVITERSNGRGAPKQ